MTQATVVIRLSGLCDLCVSWFFSPSFSFHNLHMSQYLEYFSKWNIRTIGLKLVGGAG